MAKEKKPAKDWYIGATHWLTASFVMPLIFVFIGGMILGLLGIEDFIILYLVMLAAILVGLYFGVIYSVKFLKKTYIIKDKNEVIKYSVIFAVCQVLIGFVYSQYSVDLETFIFSPTDLGLSAFSGIIAVVAFYLLSKKYIASIDTTK